MPRAKKSADVAENPVAQTEQENTPTEEKAPKKSTTKKSTIKKATSTKKKATTTKKETKKTEKNVEPEKEVQNTEKVVSTEVPVENSVESSVEKPVEQPKRTSRSKKRQSEEELSLSDKRKNKEPILTIDEKLSVKTEAAKYNDAFLDIVESMKNGKILTDVIAGTERIAGKTVAVVWHGDIKVIIPLEYVVEPPRRVKGEATKEDGHRFMLTKRLGAEIDYVIDKVDDEANVAVGNRLKAMSAKRKQFYFQTDKYGNNILYPDRVAEARVVATIISGIFVEVFGVETFIPTSELSYQRIYNPEEIYTVGERVLVRIKEIDRHDDFTVDVTVSIKQAEEDPYQKAVGKLQVGSQYVGKVSMIDTNGVFVKLPCGVDCLCAFPPRGRPVINTQVTVVIEGINLPRRRIWGKITHSQRII